MTDRYQIIRLITKDPLGGIYLANDTRLNQEVAFRHFNPGYNEEEAVEWKESYSRFATTLKILQHPNLIPVLDSIFSDDDAVIITQHIEAETIADSLKNGRWSSDEAEQLVIDLLSAMKAAHAMGVCHGSMHTGSIIRTSKSKENTELSSDHDHRHVIIDLGLKKLSTIVTGEEHHLEDPILIAPELFGEDIQPTITGDLFMIGQLCYTVLAGGHPFANDSAKKCAKAYRRGKTPPLNQFNDSVPADLTKWIMKMISPDPRKRFASADEALRELKTATSPTPTEATRNNKNIPSLPPSSPQHFSQKKAKRYKVLAASLILIAALTTWYLFTPHPTTTPTIPPAAQGQETATTITLLPPKLINSIENRRKPVVIEIESPQTLDWIIPTDTILSGKSLKKTDGHTILSIEPCEGIREFPFPHNPIRFLVNDKKIIPRAATDQLRDAKPGQGWKMTLRAPPNCHGPLQINFYMTQWFCDLLVEVNGPESTSSFKVPASIPGVFKIPIFIPNAKAGEFYSIKVTATSEHPQKGLTMGLNGIQVKQN